MTLVSDPHFYTTFYILPKHNNGITIILTIVGLYSLLTFNLKSVFYNFKRSNKHACFLYIDYLSIYRENPRFWRWNVVGELKIKFKAEFNNKCFLYAFFHHCCFLPFLTILSKFHLEFQIGYCVKFVQFVRSVQFVQVLPYEDMVMDLKYRFSRWY